MRTILAALILLAPGVARADYVIWLDFSGFDMGAWRDATCNDAYTVRESVTLLVAADFAAYQVQITTVEPEPREPARTRGPFAWVAIGGADPSPSGDALGAAPDISEARFDDSGTDRFGRPVDSLPRVAQASVYTDEFARVFPTDNVRR